MGISLGVLYRLTWKEFNLKCQGLLMKYQRLSLIARQLASVIINTTPGVTEPVQQEDIWLTAFDDIKPLEVKKYTPDEWKEEQERLMKKFKEN